MLSPLINNDFLVAFELGGRVTICRRPEGEVLGGMHLKSTRDEEKAPD